MKYDFSIPKGFVIVSLSLLFQLSMTGLSAQTVKNITLKNTSSKDVKDYTLEIPVEELNLPYGSFVANVNNETVPVEIIQDIRGKQKAVIPIATIGARAELNISVKHGFAESYPKRTYAELSHKVGAQFDGRKYVGDYSWVKTNNISIPGSFQDHSYYIKYEGPGWENDKVAFRFYLDNRNAIDVFGKTVSEIVLPSVGVDGYENYHNLSTWGMDNMKVGKALGIGTLAIWDGQKAVRVEEKDSTACIISADGKIRSQVKTTYYGWKANGVKCDMVSLISIDAGTRASHMEVLMNKEIDNITTGIVKDKNSELIVSNNKNSEWSYIATFGKQSLNKDMQGLVIFARTKQIKAITEDELNHVVVLTPASGYAEYYFMPTWEMDKEPVVTKDAFMKCIDEELSRLNNNVTITIKR